MSIPDFNLKPIEAEVFRFVSIRNPQLPEKVHVGRMTARYPSGAGSSLYQALAAAVANPALVTDAQKRAACDALATSYRTDSNWLPAKADLEALYPGYLDLYAWMQWEGKALTISGLATRLADLAGDVAPVTHAWDNLMARSVLGAEAVMRAALTEIIVVDFVRNHYQDGGLGGSDAALQSLTQARVVLPKAIFPLPGSNTAIPELIQPAEPQDDDRIQWAREAREYADAHAAVSASFALAIDTLTYRPESFPIDQEGNPPLPEQLELGQPELASYNEATSNILKTHQMGPGTRYTTCLRVLEGQLGQRFGQLFEGVELNNKVVATGGAMWRLGAKADDPRIPCDPNVTSDRTGYEDFYAADGRCRIRPLGIGDLLKVEQELCCYVPGEVAHIENILQGEYKERNTRRLKRTEQTFAYTRDKETVNERDTVTADQYELQKSSSTVIQQDQAFEVGIGVSATYGVVTANLNSNFATSTATSTADAQASFYAQNVSERSLQRITERVREERITTIIEEYEENNKHGLDNRLGTAHVVGLYRWADKLYKMRLVNYGKRLMFEFLIPEPAAFHLWATSQPDTSLNVPLVEPIDPTSAAVSAFGLQPLDLKRVAPWDYHLWGKAYGVALDPPPAEWRTIAKSYHEKNLGNAAFAMSFSDLEVPDGYRADAATAYCMITSTQSTSFVRLHIGAGLPNNTNPITVMDWRIFILSGNHVELIPVSITGITEAFTLNVSVICQRLPETYAAWQTACFGKIMEAYRVQKSSYDNALSEAKNGFGAGRIETNPAMNRQIEHSELKKGCLNWLHYGGRFHTDGVVNYDSTDDCQPPQGLTDCCTIRDTERVKFLEQVFDWRNMTYQFHPYFYGQQCRWKKLYQIQGADPLFVNFLQAGMARVLVPARLGFEEQAMHYLRTGEIWSGGPVPLYDSELQTSILLDLYPGVESDPVVATWEMRVPTTLTVLQCESGCTSGDGLPCSCGNGIGAGTHAHMVGTDADTTTTEPSTHA